MLNSGVYGLDKKINFPPMKNLAALESKANSRWNIQNHQRTLNKMKNLIIMKSKNEEYGSQSRIFKVFLLFRHSYERKERQV